MSKSRSLAVAGVSVVLLAIAVPIGKTEGSRSTTAQIAGIEATRQAVGSSADSPRLRAFRIDRGWACLVYVSNYHFYGYELCYDHAGRLVEAVERRGTTRTFWTVAFQPQLAPVREQPSTIRAILRRHGVSPKFLRESGY